MERSWERRSARVSRAAASSSASGASGASSTPDASSRSRSGPTKRYGRERVEPDELDQDHLVALDGPARHHQRRPALGDDGVLGDQVAAGARSGVDQLGDARALGLGLGEVLGLDPGDLAVEQQRQELLGHVERDLLARPLEPGAGRVA